MNPVTELWAVCDKEDGTVKWTRGGSSTTPRLMVYVSEAKAEAALKNTWIKQIYPIRDEVCVKRVYEARNDPRTL